MWRHLRSLLAAALLILARQAAAAELSRELEEAVARQVLASVEQMSGERQLRGWSHLQQAHPDTKVRVSFRSPEQLEPGYPEVAARAVWAQNYVGSQKAPLEAFELALNLDSLTELNNELVEPRFKDDLDLRAERLALFLAPQAAAQLERFRIIEGISLETRSLARIDLIERIVYKYEVAATRWTLDSIPLREKIANGFAFLPYEKFLIDNRLDKRNLGAPTNETLARGAEDLWTEARISPGQLWPALELENAESQKTAALSQLADMQRRFAKAGETAIALTEACEGPQCPDEKPWLREAAKEARLRHARLYRVLTAHELSLALLDRPGGLRPLRDAATTEEHEADQGVFERLSDKAGPLLKLLSNTNAYERPTGTMATAKPLSSLGLLEALWGREEGIDAKTLADMRQNLFLRVRLLRNLAASDIETIASEMPRIRDADWEKLNEVLRVGMEPTSMIFRRALVAELASDDEERRKTAFTTLTAITANDDDTIIEGVTNPDEKLNALAWQMRPDGEGVMPLVRKRIWHESDDWRRSQLVFNAMRLATGWPQQNHVEQMLDAWYPGEKSPFVRLRFWNAAERRVRAERDRFDNLVPIPIPDFAPHERATAEFENWCFWFLFRILENKNVLDADPQLRRAQARVALTMAGLTTRFKNPVDKNRPFPDQLEAFLKRWRIKESDESVRDVIDEARAVIAKGLQ